LDLRNAHVDVHDDVAPTPPRPACRWSRRGRIPSLQVPRDRTRQGGQRLHEARRTAGQAVGLVCRDR
jgi:hypothetical protein